MGSRFIFTAEGLRFSLGFRLQGFRDEGFCILKDLNLMVEKKQSFCVHSSTGLQNQTAAHNHQRLKA